MDDFTVYLTSLGSVVYFPENDNSTFSNLLQTPLRNMSSYKVGLAGCHISAVKPTDTIIVCSNIVANSFFNDKQLPIVGVYSSAAREIQYTKLVSDEIYVITCSLVDASGKKISLDAPPLISLHFRKF